MAEFTWRVPLVEKSAKPLVVRLKLLDPGQVVIVRHEPSPLDLKL
jgi:hypothetical protein